MLPIEALFVVNVPLFGLYNNPVLVSVLEFTYILLLELLLPTNVI